MHPPISFRYKAFLSYSHRDKGFAASLHRALERWRVPNDLVGRETAAGPVPGTLRPIFRDHDDFSASHSLTDQTLLALKDSQWLIVVCSVHSAKSAYVNEEIRAWKAIGRSNRILALILNGEPGDPECECFPPALKFVVNAEGQVTNAPEHPIAADARRQGEGKDLAVQKLAAGLLGLPLDEVRKRAWLDWKHRSMRAALGAAVAGVVVIVAVFLHIERIELKREMAAQKQETSELVNKLLARFGTSSAEASQRQTLGETLKDSQRQAEAGDTRMGQALDLLRQGKIEEATQLYEQVARDKAAQAAQNNKEAAAAFRNLGSIAGLRNPRQAREAYAKAAELDPDDSEGMYWHAVFEFEAGNAGEAERSYNRALANSRTPAWVLYWSRIGLGDVRALRGDIGQALGFYNAAQMHADASAKDDFSNLEWQRNLAVGYERIGAVLETQGDLVDALAKYRESFAIRKRLTDSDKANTEWQRDLSVSYDRIGNGLKAQGDLPAALANYREAFAIRKRLAGSDMANARWQHDLAMSHEKISDVLKVQGDLPAALASYRESFAIFKRLADSDKANGGWQRDVSVSYNRIGDGLKAQGDLPGALANYRESLVIIRRLADNEKVNVEWQRDLSISYDKIGDVLEAQGDLTSALESRRMSLELRERLSRENPDNRQFLADYASALGNYAFTAILARDFDKALNASERALALAPDQLRPVLSTNKAHALMFLGRAEEALNLHRRYMGHPTGSSGDLWEKEILSDFAEFEKHGLTHPQMAQIKEVLAASQPR